MLKETDGLDSAQKGEAAIRTIEWTTLVGKRLNQMRAKLQVDAVEHFARVTKFQAEVVSVACTCVVCVARKASTYIRVKLHTTYVRNCDRVIWRLGSLQ